MPKKIDFLNLMTDFVDIDTSNNLRDLQFDDAQFKFMPHKLLLPPCSVNLSLVYPKDKSNDLSLVEENTNCTEDDTEEVHIQDLKSFLNCDDENEPDSNDDNKQSTNEKLSAELKTGEELLAELKNAMVKDDKAGKTNDNDELGDEKVWQGWRRPVNDITIKFIDGFIADNIINSNMDNEAKQKIIQRLDTTEAHIVKPANLSNKESMAWNNWAYHLEDLSWNKDGYTILTNFEGHLYPSRNILHNILNYSDSLDFLSISDVVEFRIINIPDAKFLPFND